MCSISKRTSALESGSESQGGWLDVMAVCGGESRWVRSLQRLTCLPSGGVFVLGVTPHEPHYENMLRSSEQPAPPVRPLWDHAHLYWLQTPVEPSNSSPQWCLPALVAMVTPNVPLWPSWIRSVTVLVAMVTLKGLVGMVTLNVSCLEISQLLYPW